MDGFPRVLLLSVNVPRFTFTHDTKVNLEVTFTPIVLVRSCTSEKKDRGYEFVQIKQKLKRRTISFKGWNKNTTNLHGIAHCDSPTGDVVPMTGSLF